MQTSIDFMLFGMPLLAARTKKPAPRILEIRILEPSGCKLIYANFGRAVTPRNSIGRK